MAELSSGMSVDHFFSTRSTECLGTLTKDHSAECHKNYPPTMEAIREKDRLEDLLITTASVAILVKKWKD